MAEPDAPFEDFLPDGDSSPEGIEDAVWVAHLHGWSEEQIARGVIGINRRDAFADAVSVGKYVSARRLSEGLPDERAPRSAATAPVAVTIDEPDAGSDHTTGIIVALVVAVVVVAGFLLPVTWEVEGNGDAALLYYGTYTEATNAQSDAELPWRESSSNIFSARSVLAISTSEALSEAADSKFATQITCRMKVLGITLTEKTSRGGQVICTSPLRYAQFN